MRQRLKILLGVGIIVSSAALVVGLLAWVSAPSSRDVSFYSTGPSPPLLAATLYLPGTPGTHPGVVVFHGVGGSRQGTAGIGQALARAGIVALCIDDRGHGDSGGFINVSDVSTWNGTFFDAPAALDFLAQQPEVDPNELGAQGYSLGGGQTMLLALTGPRLKAVVAWAPFLDCNVNDTREADMPVPPSTWPVRGLILQGTADTTSNPENSQNLTNRWNAMQIELFPGVTHIITGTDWNTFLNLTQVFFAQQFGTPLNPLWANWSWIGAGWMYFVIVGIGGWCLVCTSVVIIRRRLSREAALSPK
ncbi:MAG TPA: alpha/beta fold hydrolase [Candidatus Lokiarchaeia archaeon]|nr:alpha/beta fold hydrolase [Candidatus Lokiarchaeia archaeon]